MCRFSVVGSEEVGFHHTTDVRAQEGINTPSHVRELLIPRWVNSTVRLKNLNIPGKP